MKTDPVTDLVSRSQTLSLEKGSGYARLSGCSFLQYSIRSPSTCYRKEVGFHVSSAFYIRACICAGSLLYDNNSRNCRNLTAAVSRRCRVSALVGQLNALHQKRAAFPNGKAAASLFWGRSIRQGP